MLNNQNKPHIYIEPQRRIVFFGNGVSGRIVRERAGIIERDGVVVTEFVIQPSRHMLSYYDIRRNMLDVDGYITRRYPSSLIKVLNNDPVVPVTLVKCGFHWEDTVLTDEPSNTEEIENLQRRVKEYQSLTASLYQELNKVVSRQTEYMAGLVNYIQTVRKAGGDIIREENVEEEGTYRGEER